MLNLISILIGLVALIVVVPAQVPLLGWANWVALPLVAIGAGLGQLSGSSKAGRNFCLLVGLIAVVRLALGGGIL